MLRAVLFDLDNTLVDRNRAFRESVHSRFDNPDVCAELLRRDQGGRGDRAALFACWEQQSGGAMNQTRFGQLIAEHLQPDRNLIRALQAHSSTLKLGLITNGGSKTQRQKIRAAGLEEVFPADRVWISAEVGHEKPGATIFLRACQSLGTAPASCLFVGDHEQDDLHGAMNAGLRVRLVDSVLDANELNRLLGQEALR